VVDREPGGIVVDPEARMAPASNPGAEAQIPAVLREFRETLLETADRIEGVLVSWPRTMGGMPASDRLGWLSDLLVDRVVPRLRAEEEVLYPVVGPDVDLKPCGSEHDRIRALIETVSSLVRRLQTGRCRSRSAERVLRDRLRDLADLLRGHAHEEARICAPVLIRMEEERRGELELAVVESEREARREVRLVLARLPEPTEAVVLRSNPHAGRAFVVELGELQPEANSPDGSPSSRLANSGGTAAKTMSGMT
jgi:hypothetical protein